MKRIPNILSFSRIPLSILLIYIAFLVKQGTIAPAVFLVLYTVTGLTDAFDGFLARRYHWESKLGAKLDGFADVTLVLSMLVIVFAVLRIQFSLYVLIAVGVIAVVRIVNLLMTRIKFKQWGTMHSFLIRYGSLPIYAVVPIFVWTGKSQDPVIDILAMVVLAIILLSVVEETAILAVMDEYDMNMKSVIHARRQKKASQ